MRKKKQNKRCSGSVNKITVSRHIQRTRETREKMIGEFVFFNHIFFLTSATVVVAEVLGEDGGKEEEEPDGEL